MIEIAFIGCGRIASFRHIPECAEHPETAIAGYYNRTISKAEALAGQYGGKVYQTVEDCIHDPEVDAVVISTSNATHVPYSIAALKAGKHVICEKPMAANMAECEAMVKAARDNNRILLVAAHERYTQTHQLARRLIENGEAGRPLSFRCIFAHGGPEQKRSAEQLWFFDKKNAGLGVMADLGVHKVDLIRFLLGDEVKNVTSCIDTLDKCDSRGEKISVEDNAIFLMQMNSGAMGTVTVSWTCYGEEQNTTTIYGSEGIMSIPHPMGGRVEIVRKNGERKTFYAEENRRANGWAESGIIRCFADLYEKYRQSGVAPIPAEDSLNTMQVIFKAKSI